MSKPPVLPTEVKFITFLRKHKEKLQVLLLVLWFIGCLLLTWLPLEWVRLFLTGFFYSIFIGLFIFLFETV